MPVHGTCNPICTCTSTEWCTSACAQMHFLAYCSSCFNKLIRDLETVNFWTHTIWTPCSSPYEWYDVNVLTDEGCWNVSFPIINCCWCEWNTWNNNIQLRTNRVIVSGLQGCSVCIQCMHSLSLHRSNRLGWWVWILHQCEVKYGYSSAIYADETLRCSQPAQSLLALGAAYPIWLPGPFAGSHPPTALPLMPGLDAHANCVCWFCSLKSSLGVRGEGSKWSPLSRGYCGLHWSFSHVQVFCILFALLLICVDTVHELRTRGDLTIPRCADSKRATKVSWLEKGKDPLSDQD